KPEAIQLIIRRLQARDPPWKLKLMELVTKQSVIRFHFQTAVESRRQGLAGCRLFGPEAKAAIPALTNLLYHTNTTWDGALGLVYIGSDSISPLLGALST